MKRLAATIAFSILLAGCASKPAPAPSPPPTPLPAVASGQLNPGAINYGVRCMGCHEPATPGAPTRQTLARLSPDAIVAALMTGKMKIIAETLPEQEAREIAVYLTGKPMLAKGALPALNP